MPIGGNGATAAGAGLGNGMGSVGGSALRGAASGAAAGSFIGPWGTAIGGLIGAGVGLVQGAKARKGLQDLTNSYQPNASINDYYNKALQRYSMNPYQSNAYKAATQSAGQGLATGLNYLQSAHQGLAGIGSLVQGYNDATRKAAATAEGQQGQELSQLGNATGMKAGEDKYPFQLKYNLLAAQAAGANQVTNTGLSNLSGGLSSLSQMQILRKMYGGQ